MKNFEQRIIRPGKQTPMPLSAEATSRIQSIVSDAARQITAEGCAVIVFAARLTSPTNVRNFAECVGDDALLLGGCARLLGTMLKMVQDQNNPEDVLQVLDQVVARALDIVNKEPT